VILLAPHPDDEVLGAGGLLQWLIAAGAEIELLAVTNGEGSHPQGSAARTRTLGEVRPRESLTALRRLGCRAPVVTRLGLPDGRVAEHEERLCDELADRAHEDDLWLAPWWSDGHPDHDACGRAASAVAEQLGVRSLSYLVWAWHWADPCGVDIPWEHCRRHELNERSTARKRWSIEAFSSQIRPLGPQPGDAPVLPLEVLRRFWRSFEVFVEAGME
jgi:LmbE family N-acetylglucosaminyl deacetylase